jgi:hypothetical protein
MKMIKKIWPFIFLLFVLIFSTINSIINGIYENKKAYNFQITKLESTPTSRLIFYDGKNEITLWNYTVMNNEGVQVGDYLIKGKCSEFLFINRKNESGEFIEITKSNNDSYFANLMCD